MSSQENINGGEKQKESMDMNNTSYKNIHAASIDSEMGWWLFQSSAQNCSTTTSDMQAHQINAAAHYMISAAAAAADHVEINVNNLSSFDELPSSHNILLHGILEKGESSEKYDVDTTQMQQQQQQRERESKENTATEDKYKKSTGECRQQKRRRSAELHNLSERLRRQRLKEKMKTLQEMIPNCNKRDKASTLDDVINYIKTLQYQAQMMSMGAGFTMLHSPWMISPITKQGLMHNTGQQPLSCSNRSIDFSMMSQLGGINSPACNSLVSANTSGLSFQNPEPLIPFATSSTMSRTSFFATTTSDPSFEGSHECTSHEDASSSQGASSSRFE